MYSVIRGDASERDAWGAKDASPCFVVALEVLDNLPHDKVIFRKDSERGGHGDHDGWFQTRVRLDPETNKHVKHHSEPLSDALAVRAMETLADAARGETETSFARRVARVSSAWRRATTPRPPPGGGPGARAARRRTRRCSR